MGWKNTTTHGFVTRVRRYSQCLEAKLVPAVLVDGKPVSWRRSIVNLNSVEKTTETRGLTRATAVGSDGNGGLCATLGSSITTEVLSGGETFESASSSTEAYMANPADGWTVAHTQKTSSLHVSA